MRLTLLMDKSAKSCKTPGTSRKTGVWNKYHTRLNYVLLKTCYLIGTFIALSHVLLFDLGISTGHLAVERLCLFSSWLFITIGFCIATCCSACLSENKYSETLPAATDAFLYGMAFGLFSLLGGLENAIVFGGPIGPLLFGLVGMFLVHIESVESFKTTETDDIVLVI
ncbi:hypothetical protein AAHC03_01835 [Spirometra sp. Aus1]